MQLKSEALIKLELDKEALKVLKTLSQSPHKQTSIKAVETITKILSRKAIDIDSNESPQKAVYFFIEEHIKLNLTPSLNAQIKSILQKCEPESTNFSDPILSQHQLQLRFNTIVIDCLEAQLHEQGHTSAPSPAQKPGAISKTAS